MTSLLVEKLASADPGVGGGGARPSCFAHACQYAHARHRQYSVVIIKILT